MMDIEVPNLDVDYDYVLELLITGEIKQHVKDAIVSIAQKNVNVNFNSSVSAMSTTAASMDENEIYSAMAHLAEDEKRKILDVVKRAQALDQQTAPLSRRVSIDHTDHQSRTSSRRSSLDRNAPAVCPICVDVEVVQDLSVPDGAMPTNFRQNVCSECKKIVCKDCGKFELDTKTKFQVWICSFCSGRRRHMLPFDAYYNSRPDKVQRDMYVEDYYDQLPDYYNWQPQPLLSDRRPSLDSLTQEFPQQRFQPVPLTVLTPPSPETPRAQRPNFLQISDKEYFGVRSNSGSNSSLSSGSSQHKQSVVTDSSQRSANHNRAKENTSDSMTAGVASSSSFDYREPPRRLAQHSQSSLESTEGADGEYRDARHRPQREVLNDFYLSEEKELAMISKQLKHPPRRSEDYQEEFERVSSPGDESDLLDDPSRSYPLHDWSPPVADLSPIEDVPATMELAEEAEWLAYQRNGKRRQGSGESDSSNNSSKSRAKSTQDAGKDPRLRSLSTEIDQMLRHQPLEILREQSSGEDYPGGGGANLLEHANEDIFDRDKDSQTSTVESGYESQSKDQQPVPPCPLPRSQFIKDFTEVVSEHNSMDIVRAAPRGERTHSLTDGYEDTQAKLDQPPLCDLDVEDDVPVVAEGTTYNIHGGRDMFAKKSDKPQKPAIPRKPSLDVITRTRNFQRQRSSEGDSRLPERSISAEESQSEQPSYKPHTQEGEGQNGILSNDEQELSVGVLVKDREILVPLPERRSPLSPSSPSAMSLINAKPIPAPRRKADNSVRAKPPANRNQELDDEIGEIRFDDGDSDSSASAQRCHTKDSISSEGSGSADTSLSGKRDTHPRNNGRSISVDLDARRANIQRSMDELRKREEDENEITKALEKQLNDIRKLEDRQRNILEHTLQQVLQSVNKDAKNVSAAGQKDEIQIDSRIDCSSLLSPSFNRKTLLNSPLMSHRTTASPQSPRKLSSSGRRQDMQTINENGSYSLAEVAAMSPASSHRTLSSMASPLLQSRTDYGSHVAPPRRLAGGLGDPFMDKNFRLSASYTELPPQVPDSTDRSGYFSDREADRRRGGEDLKNFTDEARNSWLQFEIEKRREQVEKNNALRFELQKHIQAQSIPASRYDKLRELYRDHINASREYLGFSSNSLSSLSTGRGMRPGYEGFTTDSEYMSSTEHLAGSISQSSTIERLKHSSDSLYRQVGPGKHMYPANHRPTHANPPNASNGRNHSDVPPGQRNHPNQQNNEDFSAMPLLDVRAPKSTASSPNSACELVKIGEISRATSDASFGDPEERIIDAKLEGGKTIMRSKEKETTAKGSASTHAMPASRFNFPTKRVLITPDSTSRETGLGLVIRGGQPVPHQHGVHGAFVQELQSATVTEQLLGELKPGDEIVEWNGVSLRNRTDGEVQNIIERSSGEIELTIKLDKQPYKLPKHQRNRVDHDRIELASAGFESPQSDKSWTREFDEGRQSLGRSRRGTADTIVSHAELEDINEQFRRKGRGEMREEQIERVLQDMGERLDVMDRQPHSPQEEFEKSHPRLPHQQSSASTVDQDVNSTDTEHSSQLFTKMNHVKDGNQNQQSGNTRLEQQRENSADSMVASSSVTRSSSDISTQARIEHDRDRIMVEQGTRRMSHQDRLRHPNPPVSPRAGRHPSMPRLENCGELEAMFMYDYGRHMLVVRIERAVGLALPGEPKLDPFIKVHFLRNNTVKEKRCTRYIESTNHPKWEQSFSVSVEEDELRMYKIKMAAWNYFHPRQNTFIGAVVVDLATAQHVDGNLRMYKLDSSLGDRRDVGHGSTPLMSRGSRAGAHGNKKPHSNSMSPHPQKSEHQNSAVSPRFHPSANHSHSLHSSPQHSPQRSSSSSSHRDSKSGRSNSLHRYSNPSSNSTQAGEDNYHIRQSHHLSPSHSQQQPGHLPHSNTNGISGHSQELNNNNAIKPGRGMNRAHQLRH